MKAYALVGVVVDFCDTCSRDHLAALDKFRCWLGWWRVDPIRWRLFVVRCWLNGERGNRDA